MSKLWFILCALPLALIAEESGIAVISETPVKQVEVTQSKKGSQSTLHTIDSSYKAFTGRINGNNVRLRVGPELESNVVSELGKDELVVVTGQKGDFYAVQPLSDQKAYIFRSFILDGYVEGNRVNVRLKPDLEAPIIGHLSSGSKVDGEICQSNHKWLEIDPPASTHFFVAKEYIDHVGGPELKAIKDKRCATVNQLLDSANLLTQAEMRKPYNEIDIDRLTRNYLTVVNDYVDFPDHCAIAKKNLTKLQEEYLQKKIAYLENRAENMGKVSPSGDAEHFAANSSRNDNEEVMSHTDRMKIWEPVEEAIYLTWSGMHHQKTMDDFYAAQKLKSVKLSGIIEAYTDPIKCKPGDYVLRQDGVPAAYLYSTNVNLQALVGKKVTLLASSRGNNNFAFPAYYVLDTE